jgi:hypothetical protein
MVDKFVGVVKYWGRRRRRSTQEEKLLLDVVVFREQKGGSYISRVWPSVLFGSVLKSGDNSGYCGGGDADSMKVEFGAELLSTLICTR